MKPLTIKDLMYECVKQVDKGNGNKRSKAYQVKLRSSPYKEDRA